MLIRSHAGPVHSPCSLAIVLLSLATVLVARRAAGDEQAPPPRDETADRVVARVDGHTITEWDIDRELQLALRDRPLEPDAQPALRRTVLEQLVKRQLVLSYLSQRKLAASESDITFAIDRIRRRAEQSGGSLSDYLRRQRLTEPQLRDRLNWQLSWQRYLDRFLTDENLERYFDKHRPHFDGTEIRVAHILLKPDSDSAEAWQATMDEATRLAEQIRSRQLSFAEAARSHSQAPTAAQGGDLGFIERHEPMPEPFSRSAFDLKPGEVSPLVTTPFGVHLITALEIKSGQRTWREAREDLKQAVTQYLFDWCAGQQRERVQVDYP